ncbi:MAG: MauE/DoxX family redox-associated membrane protein [Actinomycetota bacterium]
MVETISPVVYGTRARWAAAVALHAAGAAATAAAFGAGVAALGALLGAPWGKAGAAILAGVALVYVARELTGARIAVPQLRRQVPDWWRTYFGRPLAAFLYGAGLGIGFLTFLGHGTLVVVTVGAASAGRPLLGALVMAPFGLARGLAPLVGARSRGPEDGARLVDRLSSMSGRLRSGVNAVASVTVGVAAAAAASRTDGGWGRAAAAILAVSFAWAAVSKLAGWSRWRRTLSAHALPRNVERLAAWAVPATESLIPILTVLGGERAAAAVALASIAVFSLALVRIALRDGVRVACGCFGRASIDVRLALARNAALAATAVASWSLATPDPSLMLPEGIDVVPALLVGGALTAAAVTAWRTTAWLGRGRA